jgi:GntR family transcriptional regulator
MLFQIDFHHSKPVYQQLIDQIKFAVASGRLRSGEKLPSIREVAVQARINRNTVAKVYGELEREGVVYSRPGQGSFISDRGSALSQKAQANHLQEKLDEVLAQARLFGFSKFQLQQLINNRLKIVFNEDNKETTK